MTPRPDSHGRTDAGLVRKQNEDQFLISELSKWMEVRQTSLPIRDSTRLSSQRSGYLYLVADGLGGAPAGDRASSIAVDSVLRYVLNVMPWFFRLEQREEALELELKKVLEKCQVKIEADVAENPSRSGMGTTLTMAYVLWPELYVVHVGDARAYLLRGEKLTQITQDHTLAGALGSKVAPAIRKVLWNVIGGGSSDLQPEVYHLTMEPGDLLLLATDGLTRHVTDPRIAQLLGDAPTASAACDQLISEANKGGGRDNITTVVSRFKDPMPPSDSSSYQAMAAVSSETTQQMPVPSAAPSPPG